MAGFFLTSQCCFLPPISNAMRSLTCIVQISKLTRSSMTTIFSLLPPTLHSQTSQTSFLVPTTLPMMINRPPSATHLYVPPIGLALLGAMIFSLRHIPAVLSVHCLISSLRMSSTRMKSSFTLALTSLIGHLTLLALHPSN